MSIVNGQNFIGYIFEGTWKPWVCGRSISFNVTTDYQDVSVSGHGKDRMIAPTRNSFSASADGVVSLNEPGSFTLPEIRAKQLAHEVLLMRFERTDRSGNVYTDECYMYITNSSDSGNFDGINVFSLEFQGTGTIIQVFTPTASLNTNPEMRYQYTGTGGETGFTEASLIGKYIIETVKNGIGNSKIITSGTPVGQEVKYTSATGAFEWPVPFEVGEEAYIIYRDI